METAPSPVSPVPKGGITSGLKHDEVPSKVGVTPTLGLRGCYVDEATRWLLVSCFSYMISFMWMQFLTAWTVNHITSSSRLVQFTGLCVSAHVPCHTLSDLLCLPLPCASRLR